MTNVLIFGKSTGWLANRYHAQFASVVSEADIADLHAVTEEIKLYRPSVVINAAGMTGTPNIDACMASPEAKDKAWRSNTHGAAVVATACAELGVYLVHLSSGCIYQGPSPVGGFTEEDVPAKPPSFYAQTKLAGDNLILQRMQEEGLRGVILRVRIPFDPTWHPRNKLQVILHHAQLVRVKESMTFVGDLVYVTRLIIERQLLGIYNLVNPQPIAYERIVQLWEQTTGRKHQVVFISPEDLMARGLVHDGRSMNVHLNTDKLERDLGGLPHLQDTEVAIDQCLSNMYFTRRRQEIARV